MSKELQLKSLNRLLIIMDELREKCPWDKKQTFDSLKPLTIEETYELVEAISENNVEEIKNELGDLLLHIVFYSKIASESNKFDFADVANSIAEKLIYRHPHVYENNLELDEDQVKLNWEKLKLKDGKRSVLEGVPKTLPPILKSMRIQQKASNIGFNWSNEIESKEKVNEELKELNDEINSGNLEKINNEFGDVLFSLINYGKHIGVNPDSSLEKANKRFINRFKYVEEKMNLENKTFENLSKIDLKKYWDLAKKQV
ncbi:MAG: nucleoside triphosphate pyrophosphohydrolase [Flavobacteriaceae bacterium]|nr:nucleoside triphosphate pyrophosphohydrolase [Flavobacteriaceae bacterium]